MEPEKQTENRPTSSAKQDTFRERGMSGLRAPFPYYGGKRHYAPMVWERFGKVDRYIEPFFGTGAILLGNPEPAKMEIACDLNGFIANFWRAIQHDPEQTAEYASYPSFHQDLTARHAWLRNWFLKHGRLIEDPEFYDCKVAGWWVWGMSIWIGGEFCNVSYDRMPRVHASGGGTGTMVQINFDKHPIIKPSGGGGGVNMQMNLHDKRLEVKPGTGGGRGVSMQSDRRPTVMNSSGKGVSMQRERDQVPYINNEGGGMGYFQTGRWTSQDSQQGEAAPAGERALRGHSQLVCRTEQSARKGDRAEPFLGVGRDAYGAG